MSHVDADPTATNRKGDGRALDGGTKPRELEPTDVVWRVCLHERGKASSNEGCGVYVLREGTPKNVGLASRAPGHRLHLTEGLIVESISSHPTKSHFSAFVRPSVRSEQRPGGAESARSADIWRKLALAGRRVTGVGPGHLKLGIRSGCS